MTIDSCYKLYDYCLLLFFGSSILWLYVFYMFNESINIIVAPCSTLLFVVIVVAAAIAVAADNCVCSSSDSSSCPKCQFLSFVPSSFYGVVCCLLLSLLLLALLFFIDMEDAVFVVAFSSTNACHAWVDFWHESDCSPWLGTQQHCQHVCGLSCHNLM